MKKNHKVGAHLIIAHEVFNKTKKYIHLPEQGKIDFLYNAADVIAEIERNITSLSVSWRDVLEVIEGFPKEDIAGPGLITQLRQWADREFPYVPGSTHLFGQSFKSAYKMIVNGFKSRDEMYATNSERRSLPSIAVKNIDSSKGKHVNSSGFTPSTGIVRGQLI